MSLQQVSLILNFGSIVSHFLSSQVLSCVILIWKVEEWHEWHQGVYIRKLRNKNPPPSTTPLGYSTLLMGSDLYQKGLHGLIVLAALLFFVIYYQFKRNIYICFLVLEDACFDAVDACETLCEFLSSSSAGALIASLSGNFILFSSMCNIQHYTQHVERV